MHDVLAWVLGLAGATPSLADLEDELQAMTRAVFARNGPYELRARMLGRRKALAWLLVVDSNPFLSTTL